jgi:hypothetical protein
MDNHNTNIYKFNIKFFGAENCVNLLLWVYYINISISIIHYQMNKAKNWIVLDNMQKA